MRRPKIYMAGPDVFVQDPLALAARKKEILAALGLDGQHPFDNEISAESGDIAAIIRQANCDMMRNCDAIIANITPFRGPSADVGTAYEIGFMEALGKPAYLYSAAGADYMVRVEAWNGRAADQDGRDRDGMKIEDFGLADNLMLAAARTVYTDADTMQAFRAAANAVAADFAQAIKLAGG